MQWHFSSFFICLSWKKLEGEIFNGSLKAITWISSNKWTQLLNYRELEVLLVKCTKSIVLNIFVKWGIRKSKKLYMVTPLMNDVFLLRQNTFNLWNFYVFATDVPTNKYLFSFSSFVYRATQLSESLPFDLKNSDLLELLKNRLKNLRGTEFPCHICSRLLVGIGYV